MYGRSITVIMPIHGEGAAIVPVFESLEAQHCKEYVREILVIGGDDGITNAYAEQYTARSQYSISRVSLESSSLADKFNRGIEMASSRFVLLMHGDSVVVNEDSYARFMEPFSSEIDVVGANSRMTMARSLYEKYPFWQKCLFARQVGVEVPTNFGKYNMFDRQLLLDRVGLLDPAFPFGCEDADMSTRIRQAGLRVVVTGNQILHAHPVDQKSSWATPIRRERIHAEAHGRFFAKHGVSGYQSFLLLLATFFRPLLAISLIVPHVRPLSVGLLVVYSIGITYPMYVEEFRNPRIIILPLVNALSLIVGAFYSIKGLVFWWFHQPPE